MSYELIPLGMNVPQIAEAFAASGLFADARDMAKSITKIIAGRDYGLGPFAAMSGMHVIKGKVEASAHVVAGAIKASGKYTYRVLTKTESVCRIEFRERDERGNWETLGVEEFTLADAEQAGLSGSAMYSKYPKNMLYNRCMSNGYKTHCPDVFRGAGPVYSPGELGGTVNEDGTDVAQSEPIPAKATVLGTAPIRECARPTPPRAAPPRPAPRMREMTQAEVKAAGSSGQKRKHRPEPKLEDDRLAEDLENARVAAKTACRAYVDAMTMPRDARAAREAKARYVEADGDIDALHACAAWAEANLVTITEVGSTAQTVAGKTYGIPEGL